MSFRIVSVAGTRPNFMKIAPLKREFAGHKEIFDFILIHTGQHFSPTMSKRFLEELEIGEPSYHLGIPQAMEEVEQVAEIMRRLESLLEKLKPDIVVVVGDVNSTLAATLVAVRLKLPVAHIEAGLRSFRLSMPEEQNRLITDRLSTLLFTHSPEAKENLLREGIAPSRIFEVGNIMIDSLVYNRDRWQRSDIHQRLRLQKGKYGVITLHRQENVDNYENLLKLLRILELVQARLPLVYPIHPRTVRRLREFDLEGRIRSLEGLILTEPLGYLDFMKLVADARLVLTDSGGVQEETTFLGVPCLTLREETERPITVGIGTNLVVAHSAERVTEAVNKILAGRWKKGKIPELWDGRTASRIRTVIEKLRANGCLTAHN